MNNYEKLITEDRRLVLLRLLAEARGYTLNASILTMALQRFGHDAARAVVLADLDWLDEIGLIQHIERDPVVVAKLTSAGADVAAGRSVVTGVKRPAPGA